MIIMDLLKQQNVNFSMNGFTFHLRRIRFHQWRHEKRPIFQHFPLIGHVQAVLQVEFVRFEKWRVGIK